MREHQKGFNKGNLLRRKPVPKHNNTTNRVNFTAGRVRNFSCPENKTEAKLWDSDVKSLILRARPSGSKAYFYQGRLNQKMLRIKISEVSDNGITIEEARKKARYYQGLVSDGIDPRLEVQRNIAKDEDERQEQARNSILFADVLAAYIKANKSEWGDLHLKDMQRCTAKTTRGRNGILRGFKDTRLQDFDSAILLRWLKEEKKHRPTATAKGYRFLRACLRWAHGQSEYAGIVDIQSLFDNPEIKKVLPKPKAKSDSLQSEMLPTWFDAVESIPNIVITASLKAMLLTGARREEILKLKWDDVDFQWGSLTISDKVDGQRIIPLCPYLASVINALPRRNEWVFSSATSKTGRLTEPFKAHADALRKVGLPHLSLHGLRRSFGTLSEWVACPVGIVAQIQGHKPSATAEKHYRQRPLDLLRLWHTQIEAKLLEFAGREQPEELKEGLRVVE